MATASSDPFAFRNWNPEAQQLALEKLRDAENSQWRPFFCKNKTCDGKPHEGWEFNHARPDQRPPTWSGDWLTWLLSGGRGSGKTEAGSRTVHAASKHVSRIGLVAPTGPDFRDTMVEGVSGLLATAKPGERPVYEPSKKRLTWPNGCIGQGFSAEEPDRLRGPQHGMVWMDEPAHYPLIQDVWDNALFGLRIKGKVKPKAICTTTPRATKWMKALVADPRTIISRASTYENLENLAENFRVTILDRYENTRLGRQELHGELLDDVEGALWNWEMFHILTEPPEFIKIVVAVDPAGSANRRSDETGIIVIGITADGTLVVLDDLTGKYSPAGWGQAVATAYARWSADCVVAEKNYGGDMVKYTLENTLEKSGVLAAIRLVNSRRGKAIRAEPIAALYEKTRVFHLEGLVDLEDELVSWVPGEGDSPNRLDAMVHGATYLVKHSSVAQMATPTTLSGRIPSQPVARLWTPGGSPSRRLRLPR